MTQNSAIKYDDTSYLNNQHTSWHLGVVVKNNDPERRGRIMVDCPGLRGSGEDNWTEWIEVAGTPIGGLKNSGDQGIWWPMQLGQRVMVAYVAGDPHSYVAIPAATTQEGKGENKSRIPKDVKQITKADAKDQTKIFELKTPAGHTIIMDDRAGKEKLTILNHKGAGIYISSPGTSTDKPDKKTGTSPHREEDTRGTKTVFTQDCDDPGKCKNGRSIIQVKNLNGTSFTLDDSPGRGIIQFTAQGSNGSNAGPSITLDSKNNVIILKAGSAQLVVNGPKAQIEVTKQVIQEKPFSSAPDDYCQGCYQTDKVLFTDYTFVDSGPTLTET